MKNKYFVMFDYLEMVKKSWTYERMTKAEKEKLQDLFNGERIKDTIKGTYNQRWETLNAIYYAFLIGIGYNNADWRSGKDEK